MLRSHFVIGAAGVVLVNRIVLWTSTTPAAATASALPSSALEELEIGLNVFNELDDADFSRYSSPTGEKYRSSSSETGRPAATPLRRGASRVILSANVEHRTATAAFGFDDGVGVGQPPPLRAQLAQGLLPLSGQFQFLRATCAGGAHTIE